MNNKINKHSTPPIKPDDVHKYILIFDYNLILIPISISVNRIGGIY